MAGITVREFNELMWNYGAFGIKALPLDISNNRLGVVALCWSAASDCNEDENPDDIINSYFEDYVNG